MSDSTPLLGNEGRKIEIPSNVAAPIESALSTIGGLTEGGIAAVTERGMPYLSRARPWLEFVDFSAFGLASAPSEYVNRFRANLRWFLLNYIMIGFAMAAISEITKPFTLIAVVLLIWVYFQLFGAANEGEEELVLFGLRLDARERAGLMVVLSVVVFIFGANTMQILVSFVLGTFVISVVYGCLRKPHPDALSLNDSAI